MKPTSSVADPHSPTNSNSIIALTPKGDIGGPNLTESGRFNFNIPMSSTNKDAKKFELSTPKQRGGFNLATPKGMRGQNSLQGFKVGVNVP